MSSVVSTFNDLIINSKNFFYKFPTSENLIHQVAGSSKERQESILRHAKQTRVILLESVVDLIEKFLTVKRNYGSEKEKALYKTMSSEDFIQRLFLKRPLVFMYGTDHTLLRDGTVFGSCPDWLKVGTDNEGVLRLEDYLSYDEMQVSALLGASTPTYFINNGSRQNAGLRGNPGSFQEHGILLGLVGARFEQPGKMEHQHIVVSNRYSLPENGFGKDDKKEKHRIHDRKLLEIWAEFYQVVDDDQYFFPSYEEVVNSGDSSKFIPLRHETTLEYFNADVYAKRMSITAKTLLLEANLRGEEVGLKTYVQVVGFGLGVWKVLNEQGAMVVNSFVHAISTLKLPNVSVLDFSWFRPEAHQNLKSGTKISSGYGNEITVVFSKRNTADKIDDNMLLVTSYAWDSNAFPGNEYWEGSLTASSDPAAACCSTIPQLQNAYINPFHLNVKRLSEY